MKITINFSNRWLYALIAIGILAIIGVGVYAFVGEGGVGHDLSEIQPCAAGKILQTNTAGDGWDCVDMPGAGTDTNANTECSGTYTYLSGEGACRDVRTDGDLYDTDTHGSLVCTTREGNQKDSCDQRCAAQGEICVGGTRGPSYALEAVDCDWVELSWNWKDCRCCKVG